MGTARPKQPAQAWQAYNLLVESITDAVVCAVDEDGRIRSWNSGGRNLTGYSAEDAIGLDLLDFFDVASLPWASFREIGAALVTQDAVRAEQWCVRSDRARFWAGLTISRLGNHADAMGFAVVVSNLGQSRTRHAGLAESEDRFRSTVANSPVGLALVSLEGRWIEVNRALSVLLGYSADELSRLTFQQLTHADDLEADLHLVNELLLGQRSSYQMEKRYIRKDGSVIWGLLSVSLIRDGEGDPSYFISQIQDVTDVREVRRDLEHKALHDPLTGLANRRKFQLALTDALDRARRNGTEHCLCFLDLDGFKKVNDTSGHEVGDMLLNAISRELEKAVRAGDLVARFGGDEFGLILYECPIAVGQMILKRLCDRIADLDFHRDGVFHSVTASIGLAPLTPETASAREALKRADMACYEAKRSGRNAVRVHGGAAQLRAIG